MTERATRSAVSITHLEKHFYIVFSSLLYCVSQSYGRKYRHCRYQSSIHTGIVGEWCFWKTHIVKVRIPRMKFLVLFIRQKHFLRAMHCKPLRISAYVLLVLHAIKCVSNARVNCLSITRKSYFWRI